MFLVVGDLHGLLGRFLDEVEPYIKPGDYAIVTGDFGVGFWDEHNSAIEEELYNHISEKGYTILFVDGNHENFNKLYSYEESTWNGGKVHFIRHNIIHLCRGECYQIDDITLFAMGGGYTLDRSRRVPGLTWFEQEMPNKAEYDNAIANLEAHGKVDYIISHTCPTDTVKYMASIKKYGIADSVIEERPLTDFLQYVLDSVEYKKHYFGHFHVDMELWKNEIVLLNDIRNLKTGEIIHKIDWPKVE